MLIPCLRCEDLINRPNSKNARYIRNLTDVRIHGPVEIDEYEVKKGSIVLKKFKKFAEAQIDRESRVAPIEEDIASKRAEIAALNTEFKNLPDIPGNASARAEKLAGMLSKGAEVGTLSDEISATHIAAKQITEIVPKTGIICRREECQDENDIIIWG